jgi:F-type H+-transporting ATPase subunit b
MAGNSTDIVLMAQAATPGQAAQAAATAGNAAGAATTTAAVGAPDAPIGFPPFDATTFASQILWLVICFGALYLVISRVAIPRIGGIIEARRAKIDGDLAEADRLRKETDKAIADYEAALAAARAKAHGIAEETRAANKASLDGKRAAVEADLAGKVGVAEAGIQKAKLEALGKVDEIAADTAAALVGQLTGAVSAEAARAAVASVVKG